MSLIKRMIGSGATSGAGTGRDFNVNVELNDFVAEEYREKLARLFVSNPETRKEVRNAIRKILQETRKNIAKDVRDSLEADPRKAYLGVKYSLWRQSLGGNISILATRRAGTRYRLLRQRVLDLKPNQRGGNRRPRSERTEQLDTYFGRDRGFILRFINSGTDERQTRFGRRGSIGMRRMFEISATFQMAAAQEKVSKLLEEVLAQAYEKE